MIIFDGSIAVRSILCSVVVIGCHHVILSSSLDRCSYAGTVLNNTTSYEIINRSVDLLSVSHCVLLLMSILVRVIIAGRDTREFNHWKRFLWFELVILAMSSIGSQLISSFTCRPVDVIYDFNFMSMIVMQMIGFIATLSYTYLFARRFTLPIPFREIFSFLFD